MRARYPDRDDFVERAGTRIFFEVFGQGDPTVLLLPTWSFAHSHIWKGQVPYLARHMRVITFDGRGNGRSDRPRRPEDYADAEFVADAVAVLDATATKQAVIVGLSRGAEWAMLLAAEHPERVGKVVLTGIGTPLGPPSPTANLSFGEPQPSYAGWARFNRHFWLQDYRSFAAFFAAQLFTEPHSTKQIEDSVAWALETTPATLIATATGPSAMPDVQTVEAVVRQIRCPILIIQGEQDAVCPYGKAVALARLTGAPLLTIEGAGHNPAARDPVRFNLLLRDFIAPAPPAPRWRRAASRPKRALFISSPIGLGHARRDLAIADALRALRPGLEIDWLAQHPVTEVLAARGERIHPASAFLANESRHIESRAGVHDLHVFQAVRDMDAILLANFMVFHDLVREEAYDLWIGDEAWELDYFLHENPEEKRAAYAWLTDYVGYLPMADGGEHEAVLTADYNAEMLAQIARYPRVRDRAIFIGNPEDIVPGTFGPGLPAIRAWTEEHYAFSGFIPGFDPASVADRAALRAELGYAPDEQLCIVAVGGSGVGSDLLARVMEAYPDARRRVPALRMIAVAGPRIDPATLPDVAGVEVRAYVPELYRHLAACDLAVVQGGLATTMELVATQRPFLYVPLRHHFEQNVHVRHRLERYGAGRCLDFGQTSPHDVATAIGEEIGLAVQYREVERDGARRAAALIAALV
jgi:pimeloyl-ACP methyl ester carboxylesterase